MSFHIGTALFAQTEGFVKAQFLPKTEEVSYALGGLRGSSS